MKHAVSLLLIAFFAFAFYTPHQEKKVVNATLSKEELKLYNLIITYRKANKLPTIPLSKSLTYVAQTHAKDLYDNHPDVGKCNQHSWSNKGKWKPVCYTDDHKNAALMWSKPSELTNYKGEGFEIACYGEGMNAEEALDCWKGSEHHNNVILNKDIWKGKVFNAIGIGMYKEKVCVWFGFGADPDGEPVKPK